MLKAIFCRKMMAGACILGLIAAALASHAAVEVITLRYRSPSEVLPFVKPLLSAEGRISADDRTGQLIIVDSDDAIARIRQTLAALDRQAPQATVRVRFQETGEQEGRSIAGSGRASGDGWSASAGGSRRSGDGVDLRIQDRRVGRSGDSEYFSLQLMVEAR